MVTTNAVIPTLSRARPPRPGLALSGDLDRRPEADDLLRRSGGELRECVAVAPVGAMALHLQDDPPEQGLAGLDNPILPAQEDVYAPQTNTTETATARSGLAAAPLGRGGVVLAVGPRGSEAAQRDALLKAVAGAARGADPRGGVLAIHQPAGRPPVAV